ncbi:MAG: hypothetical protein GX351_09920 [Peptococcaceae bacterium]|nr:hypothetical protein [Peptococcaceae bacterium]
MPALNMKNVESPSISYSSGLLVSILLRYPEIVTISCSQQQQTISLKFLVNRKIDYFDSLQNKITQAIELYHSLEGTKFSLLEIEKNEQNFDSLIIARDLKSITLGEMNLIIEMIKAEIGEYLIIDESDLAEDELILQEEIINHMLNMIHSNGTENSITAIRDDGRVLVFNR